MTLTEKEMEIEASMGGPLTLTRRPSKNEWKQGVVQKVKMRAKMEVPEVPGGIEVRCGTNTHKVI